MTTALEQLSRTADDIHRQTIVSLVTRVLFFRSSSQINELMAYSSTAMKQRWEFLQPTISEKQQPEKILSQADKALQWKEDTKIGDFIRNAHYSLELTEQQKETLCFSNVRFSLSDATTVHALTPFAEFVDYTFVVDLIWENERWVYFDIYRVSGSFPQHILDDTMVADLSKTIAGAAEAFNCRRVADYVSSDNYDDYWNQFPKPDQKLSADVVQKQPSAAEDYWDMYDHPNSRDDEDPDSQADLSQHPDNILPESDTPRLISETVRHALAAAATAARAVKMGEADFLQLALTQYSQTH
ncbi:hypothetical protein COEREDRAFT_81695 [Coemansia reversa NRRL 1564]|uniref:Uncharacterized protein n=1 Tax=Coemansia reversa (strain ATCC 12441 / NRRL 1564) TaxID=763665 RepID=A0A2G5B9Q6_COERN|nr:hypothetical protein COEREDRAFT_81695 [Coemansia reversa NRRL 1564]|eukprot:PIA15744.1 hypothetical protein COEREDRAFT_81695 [Coemansia reversa NRRL 1564]